MKRHHISIRFLAVVVLLAGALYSQDVTERLYQEGRALLNESRWSEAVGKFDQAAADGGERADAALYWKAYAQNKQELHSEALATIEQLKRSFPNSRWLKDAKALELRTRRETGLPIEPAEQADDDLKLIAINSLMHSDAERAVPLLENVLRGDASDRVKRKALFVLTQSGRRSSKAREIVSGLARDSSKPKLQETAIQYLGHFRGEENRALLKEIYASSGDMRLKKKILESFMVARDRQGLLTAAENEDDPELRRKAISLLGVMRASEDLWRIFQTETDPGVKKSIINALFLARDHERMALLAEREQSPKLRVDAIKMLGMMGRETASRLQAVYTDSSNTDVKKAVLQAFFLQRNDQALIELARTETDRDLKKHAVSMLSMMRTKEATDFLLEILDQ